MPRTRHPKKNRARRPGRPAGDLALRDAILDAARGEFAAHGFRGTSVRAVAASAGATPAMVHYYFGDKRGLYHAMLEATLGPLLERMRAVARDAAVDHDPLASFFRAYMGRLAEVPEIPQLIVRDVLGPDAEMRDTFIENFAVHGGAAVRGLIEKGIRDGRLRADLDPKFIALSMLSLAAFPFLAAPITTRVLDYKMDADSVERLIAHAYEMFRHGAGARP